MLQNKRRTFVIAEYRPFNYGTHVLSLVLHPSSVSNTAPPTQLFPTKTQGWENGNMVIVSKRKMVVLLKGGEQLFLTNLRMLVF